MRFEPTKQKHSLHHGIYIFAGLIAIILIFTGSVDVISKSNNARQKDFLQNAIQQDIIYCYAMTGSYPDSLDTLENVYGLTYDKNTFYIDYQVLGKNIYPQVTILEKQSR